MFGFRDKSTMVTAANALAGRTQKMPIPERHFIHHTPIDGPFPQGMQQIVLGLGCFWGAERVFWETAGVYTTAVGYAAGHTANPGYEEVCSGQTGHNEVVLVVFDPNKVSLESLLKTFWEAHDPTQGMAQGNDRGTQYRSGIYCSDEQQLALANRSRDQYAKVLSAASYGSITTEIILAGPFYYAEEYHQQYLAKNPAGYCGLGGTGVSCPTAI